MADPVLHLCASEAARTLPRASEDLIRGIHNLFSVTAKRRFEFNQFQEFFEEEHHQILHPSQTRWLSLHRAVQRILKQRDALKAYFVRIQPFERLESIDKIVFYLTNPVIFNHALPHAVIV